MGSRLVSRRTGDLAGAVILALSLYALAMLGHGVGL
jgi:hypothetical protein